ncbi:hypothetical protein [Caballeronia glathei]|uniref:hypothetical protein n=1 Tax=Caballeronia glathei TaxID=60547 RepID=UPI00101A834B|nr:hypothetical protein [Caballeronia glathei]
MLVRQDCCRDSRTRPNSVASRSIDYEQAFAHCVDGYAARLVEIHCDNRGLARARIAAQAVLAALRVEHAAGCRREKIRRAHIDEDVIRRDWRGGGECCAQLHFHDAIVGLTRDEQRVVACRKPHGLA